MAAGSVGTSALSGTSDAVSGFPSILAAIDDDSLTKQEQGGGGDVKKLKTELAEIYRQMHNQNMMLNKALEIAGKAAEAATAAIHGLHDLRSGDRDQTGAPRQGDAPQVAAPPPGLEEVQPASIIKKKVKEHCDRHFLKVSREFEKNVKKTLRLTKQVQKIQEDLVLMNEGDMKYPTGTRPFRAQMENEHTDEVWEQSKDGDYNYTVKIEKGSTHRLAMRAVHHGCAMFQKAMNLELAQRQLGGLKSIMTRAHFFASCEAVPEKEINDDLELENPIGYLIDKQDLRNRAEEVYAKVCLKLKEERHSTLENEKKYKEKQEELDERLSKEKPENMLMALVTEVANKEARQAVKKELMADNDESMDEDHEEIDPEDVIKAIRQSKNGKARGPDKGGGKGRPHQPQQQHKKQQWQAPQRTKQVEPKSWGDKKHRAHAGVVAEAWTEGKGSKTSSGKGKGKGKNNGGPASRTSRHQHW